MADSSKKAIYEITEMYQVLVDDKIYTLRKGTKFQDMGTDPERPGVRYVSDDGKIRYDVPESILKRVG